jgi:hypothetical protein
VFPSAGVGAQSIAKTVADSQALGRACHQRS